ncbi:MAG: Capsular polysaccharide ABC transporter, permease protein KpsM [uncultured Sulfurovum sp.]|uniref:Transport permease protein n=1 Tax=uncultured Sulfurovum sp. TaxID=269237 RepID=A0A6S6RXP7_9BACT|nr:MAG: Capsular polysaccharide ABC transporter, permease protein KpsM [uncultured Sulfurovum sp.]
MVKRSSFKIFLAVQNALFLRELSMRFSSGRIGIFWTFFEPFFQIMVFILIKLLIFNSGDNHFDFAVFLALNFTAFNMFKNIVMKSTGAFKANKALFIYKQVKPIDTIIARTMVEIFITGIIILIFLLIGFYFDFDMVVDDLSMVGFGFLWLMVFAFAFALVVAVFNVFVDSIGKLISFFMTALMFTSAVFYPIEALPLELQHWLMYNPVAHFMEIIHGFYFEALDDRFVSYGYIFLWTIILLYMGLWLYVKLEKRIISI